MITLILARARNGVIGAGGSLPWHLPADLKRFRALTMGKPMIMGRKTFESFPAPLPGRRHIVLTRDPGWAAAGAEVVHSVAAALELAGDGDVSVIGGAEVFARFRDIADQAEVTVLWRDYDGDARFSLEEDEAWRETGRVDHEPHGDLPGYSFLTMARALAPSAPLPPPL